MDLKSVFAKNQLLVITAAILLVAAAAVFLIQPAAVEPIASPTPGASIVPEAGALSLLINNGANYTSEASVSITLSASDFEECRYSNDGEAWTDYAAPEEKFDWDFTPIDGDKEFYVQCRSEDDFERDTACIILDSTPPSISIESPEEYSTVSSPFAFEFLVTDDYSPLFDCVAHLGGALVPVGNIESHFLVNLTAVDGIYNLSVECVDEAGNQKKVEIAFAVGEPATPTFMARPTPSPTPESSPYSLEVKINGGDASTNSHWVYLDLSAIGADTCSYSNDGISYSAWESYSNYKQWNLADGDGTRTVYYRCVNSYGQSITVSDSITILEGYATPTPGALPYGLSIQIDSNAPYVNGVGVTLSLSASSASECRYSNDGSSYTIWAPYLTEKVWSIPSGDGTKYVYYQCRNAYGSSTAAHDTIILDTSPPSTVSDLIVELILSAAPNEGFMVLDWSDSTDALSGVKEYWVYQSLEPASGYSKIGVTEESYYQDPVQGDELSTVRYYYVTPIDNAGNEGETGNIAAFTP